MNASDLLKVLELTNDCPKCNNHLIGNGQGTLEVGEDSFKRTCKCGFSIELDTYDGVNEKKVMREIDKALSKIN